MVVIFVQFIEMHCEHSQQCISSLFWLSSHDLSTFFVSGNVGMYTVCFQNAELKNACKGFVFFSMLKLEVPECLGRKRPPLSLMLKRLFFLSSIASAHSCGFVRFLCQTATRCWGSVVTQGNWFIFLAGITLNSCLIYARKLRFW